MGQNTKQSKLNNKDDFEKGVSNPHVHPLEGRKTQETKTRFKKTSEAQLFETVQNLPPVQSILTPATIKNGFLIKF